MTDSSGSIVLSVTGQRTKGRLTTELTWSGATSISVDVWRNDGSGGAFKKIVTTANDGLHTGQTNYVGGGTLVYKICEAGGGTCSNDSAVEF